MIKSNYLESFCNDDITLQERPISFKDLILELSKFKIVDAYLGGERRGIDNPVLVSDLISMKRDLIRLSPLESSSGDIKVVYENNNKSVIYQYNCNIREIIELCIILMCRDSVIRCIDADGDINSYSLLREVVYYIFSDTDYINVPSIFRETIVIPEDTNLELEEDIVSLERVLWHKINRIIIPEGISGKQFLEKIRAVGECNCTISCSDKVSILSENLNREISEIPKSEVFEFEEVRDKFKDKINKFKQSIAITDTKDSTLSKIYFTLLTAIEERYSLLIEMYTEMCKKGKGKKYLWVNWETTNVHELKLLAPLCSVYCYFNNTKIIMDTKHASYRYFSDMVEDMVRGNMLSPYLGFKRLLNIKKDLTDSFSFLRSTLKKGERTTPSVSFPLSIRNKQKCYLFPLNMFLSFFSDVKGSPTLQNNKMLIYSTPSNKELSVNLDKLELNHIASKKAIQLILPKEYCNNTIDSGTLEELKEVYNYDPQESGFSKDCEENIVLEYLEHGNFIFDGEPVDRQLVLHDWILNPKLEELEAVKEYVESAVKTPNTVGNIDCSDLVRKILGFASVDEFSKVYDANEWSDEEGSKITEEDGILRSKGCFKSVNYEKQEFYNSVCEMITAALISNSDSSKYVTIHDLIPVVTKIDGKLEIFIMYCPIKPEVMWCTVQHNSLDDFKSSLRIEIGDLSGLPDSLFNFTEDESAKFNMMNIQHLLNLELAETDSLKNEFDKIMFIFLKNKISNSELADALERLKIGDTDKMSKLFIDINRSNNIANINNYLNNDEVDLYSKICLWYISTQFIGFDSSIKPVVINDSVITREEYGITALNYLYGDYYNVKGYENLEELAEIIKPEKHLKICRVINPFGGILRDGKGLVKPDMSKRFLTTGAPGNSFKYQYVNNRFMGEE